MKEQLNIVFLEAKTSDYDIVLKILNDIGLDFIPSLAQSPYQFKDVLQKFKPDLILCNQKLIPFDLEEVIDIIENSGLTTSLMLINISLDDKEDSALIDSFEKKWVFSVHISNLGEKIKTIFTIPEFENNSKRDSKEFTQSKDLLFTIYHKSPNAICVSRLSDGIIVDFNDTFSKALKYNNKELLGATGLELGFWDSIEERDQVVKAVKAKGSINDFHGCKPDKNGDLIYFTGNFELIVHERIEYLLCNFYDITEKTKAKTALKEIENQYRFLAEHATDMISRMDIHANFTYVSPASDAILGFKPEELIGRSAFGFMHPDDLDGIKKDHKQLIKTQESIIVINRVKKKNGEYVWIESKASAIFDNLEGKVIEIISVSRDVSKRKNIEDALIKSEYYYRLLAENSSDMISRHSPTGEYYYISPASLQLFGYDPEELIGHNAFDFIHEQEVEYLKKTMEEVMEQEQAKTLVYRYKHKDGKYVWIESTNKVLHDKNTGKAIEIISVSRDISPRKQVEEKLKEKIKDLDTFIYRSSHDLKGPISSMKGLINMARMEIKEEEANEFFEMMEKSVSHLDSILMDLLSITKIAQGQRNLTLIRFEEIIDEILYSLSNLPNYEKITFQKNISLKNDFMCDKALVNNILQNLILNSIVYRNSEQEKGKTIISIEEKEKFLEIIIEDDGEGISEHMQDKVYEMFYRGNLKSSGTGLGLYIVKTAVEKLNGEIMLESTVDVGTKFIIHLPLN